MRVRVTPSRLAALVLAASLALVACGGSAQPATTSSPTTAAQAAEAPDQPKLVMINGNVVAIVALGNTPADKALKDYVAAKPARVEPTDDHEDVAVLNKKGQGATQTNSDGDTLSSAEHLLYFQLTEAAVRLAKKGEVTVPTGNAARRLAEVVMLVRPGTNNRREFFPLFVYNPTTGRLDPAPANVARGGIVTTTVNRT